ncbi:hypothetical protein MLD38_016589 [Melastoma candidum]|uniref:Uncharacterized protein n=1 Tax=Melastoma candidum TaxID=119954 RepID=A0ACB9QRW9_9MYRT|nr:hypothetical protein MLD38_016589 [Melastoma candidum]
MTRAEREGLKADPILGEFVRFVKWEKFHTEAFFIGQNECNLSCDSADPVTTINENWLSARCIDPSNLDGEGVIVMQATAFLFVSMYASILSLLMRIPCHGGGRAIRLEP